MSFNGLQDIGEEIALYKDLLSKDKKISDLDWAEISEKYNLGWHGDSLRKGSLFFRRLDELGFLNFDRVKGENIENINNKLNYQIKEFKNGEHWSDKFLLIEDESKLNDEIYILKCHKIDPKLFTITSMKSNFWDAPICGGKKMMMYQNKISVKPRNTITPDLVIQIVNEIGKNISSSKLNISPNSYHVCNNKLLEVCVFDMHIGKLCYEEVTGKLYNTEIGKQRYRHIIDKIIDKALKDYNGYEKVVFTCGQDFFHFDNLSKSTTGLTVQDSDISYYELFKTGVQLWIETIIKLSQIAPVEVVYSQSNHDMQTGFSAIVAVEQFFKSNSEITNVKIDTSPKPRKYIEYGKCMIGIGHGDKEANRMGNIMATEAPEIWGRTIYREMHLGHLHKLGMTKFITPISEEDGVVIRRISSPAENDTWHTNKAYIGAVKKSQVFVWDKDYGVTDIWNIIP